MPIEKGTPLHRLSLAIVGQTNAEVFAGDVADACNLVTSPGKLVSDLKVKAAVRPGERLTLPVTEIQKLIDAAVHQRQPADDKVSVGGDAFDATVAPELEVSPVFDPQQPTPSRTPAVPASDAPGTLKTSQMPKSGNK